MKKLLILPFLLTFCYAQDRILFNNDTIMVSVQYIWQYNSEVNEVIHVSEKLYNQEYSLRVAKYEVKNYHSTDSFESWNLGGKQILYLENNWLFLCEDSKYGLRCLNFKK